ncbi:hypothetical protein CHRY9390_02183 [Chryseobacterium aquaeductus]|uniref:DUF6705 domain-containing protein n=1 Tax=Chryseobacterium aquaeductus TaxID=2675056 RepID=A0A9N8QQZ1_9FLAO|nr:DUF6705 family protein [Chryseobacterium aquaeductus]CAA7331481.1 hypothetical protein CHRY9390_02183 [Chryseobacterium potabilaquae]CAD7810464.1 hypothetical protein CHRY9390_02183 [Chryseobacterium aquaeductus]
MKKINNQLTLLFIVITTIISCKAQTLPLNTALDNITLNSYLKDLDNELTPYIGTYQSNVNGNQITLFISKQDHTYMSSSKYKYYQDILIVRYTIKNSVGVTLQSTQNVNFINTTDKNLIHSISTRPNQNIVVLDYNGTNCEIGNGTIYLKMLNATQISWRYYAETVATSHDRCPPNVDKNIYLPEGENLIFTKQ